MRKRIASINEAPIAPEQRRIAVPAGQEVTYNSWLAEQVGDWLAARVHLDALLAGALQLGVVMLSATPPPDSRQATSCCKGGGIAAAWPA